MENLKNLALALTQAQLSFEKVIKDTSGYNYKYAPLEHFYAATRPALKENNLTVIQFFEIQEGPVGQQNCLITLLVHQSGEVIKSTTPIVIDAHEANDSRKNASQTWGKAITYCRRYSYCTILGIIAEGEDDDCKKEEPKFKKDPVSLIKILKSKNIDSKEFALYHHITSDNPYSIYTALNNIDEYINQYLEMKRQKPED